MREMMAVFQKAYRADLARIAGLNREPLVDRLGVTLAGDGVSIPFFGIPHQVSAAGVVDPSGDTPNHGICMILCRYLLMGPEKEPDADDWVGYEDFRDAAPFTEAYHKNVEQRIASSFGGRRNALEQACRVLSGRAPRGIDLSCDLAMWFVPLPRVPVFLLFDDGADEFSARCRVLFERRADRYLDTQCLALLGICLADFLAMAGDV